MTNREKLKSFTNAELAGVIERIRANAITKYVDFEKWLASDKEEYVFKGEKGKALIEDGLKEKRVDCTVVGTKEVSGLLYKTIVYREGDSVCLVDMPCEKVICLI